MLTAGLSKHAQQGCLEKLNNSMTGHILRHAAYTATKEDVHTYTHTLGPRSSPPAWFEDVREKGALVE